MTYQVKLQEFEGPLDLLLHLIRKNELDIYTIRVSDIANQYLAYVEVMEQLNLDSVGDFLLMAATLAYHKSRMLLPVADDQEEEDEDGIESLEELHRRLIEYQRFKEAALALQERGFLDRDVFRVRVEQEAQGLPEGAELQLKATLFDLLDAFQRVLKRAPKEAVHEIMPERIRLADRLMEILDILTEKKSLSFEELFEGAATRNLIVVTFLSILELIRTGIIRACQTEHFGPIRLRMLTEGELDHKQKLKESMITDDYS